MKREQVIQTIRNHSIGFWYKNDDPEQPMADEVDITELTDAILALPLDVPSRVEILLKSSDNEIYVNDQQRIGFQKGAAWAIDEIIKRNK